MGECWYRENLFCCSIGLMNIKNVMRGKFGLQLKQVCLEKKKRFQHFMKEEKNNIYI